MVPHAGLLDEELERLEDPVGAEPHVLVVPPVQVRAEHVGVLRPGPRVEPRRRRPPGRGWRAARSASGARAAEADGDAELRRPGPGGAASSSLRLIAAKPWPPTVTGLAPVVDVDVGPAGEPLAIGRARPGVGVLDAAEGLVGEHDAEAERVVGGVALPHGDLVGRVELLGERGEVEAARAAADDRDLHGRGSPFRSAAACSLARISRSAKCCSLPLALRGSAAVKRTSRGYLYGAS